MAKRVWLFKNRGAVISMKNQDKMYKGLTYGITPDHYVVSRKKVGKENYFFSEKEFMAAVDLMEKRKSEG